MGAHASGKDSLMQQYMSVRSQTEVICKPLHIEDYVIQSIEDVSPPKWHLAHTTWFFETFILIPHLSKYKIYNSDFAYLFNSYYQTLGLPFPRVKRGLLSRPTVKQVYAYRAYVDKAMSNMISDLSQQQLETIASIIQLGLHHEQQHQELLMMDIKHNFSIDPGFPAYITKEVNNSQDHPHDLHFNPVEGGLIELGNVGTEFCFDNELPRHQQYIHPYGLGNRLITNSEYLEFVESGGYKNPTYWLSDGWDCVQQNNWCAPLYWYLIDNKWYVFSMTGLTELVPSEPVSHVSYYEADAYARWRGARLPTEQEWENYVNSLDIDMNQQNFLESNHFKPVSSQANTLPHQFFGDLWEWTMSPYLAYPGYKPAKGALGEYNGKFMSNQNVLRGGSCVTPAKHIRATYRNFFKPDKRWQFSGIRLASDF